MTDCVTLQDRMPEVAHGGDAWTTVELSHLRDCADCAAEWQVVRLGAALHVNLSVDAAAIASGLLSQLRDEPEAAGVAGRIAWRVGAFGLAAAASIALLVYTARPKIAAPVLASDTAAIGVLPELQDLSEPELQAVMGALRPGANEVTAGVVPHLDELTDAELEQLLRTEGGE